jgi:hypothetical protein
LLVFGLSPTEPEPKSPGQKQSPSQEGSSIESESSHLQFEPIEAVEAHSSLPVAELDAVLLEEHQAQAVDRASPNPEVQQASVSILTLDQPVQWHPQHRPAVPVLQHQEPSIEFIGALVAAYQPFPRQAVQPPSQPLQQFCPQYHFPA